MSSLMSLNGGARRGAAVVGMLAMLLLLGSVPALGGAPKAKAPPPPKGSKDKGPAVATPPAAPAGKKAIPKPTDRSAVVAPVKGDKIPFIHAPFEEGDCSICHVNKDAKNPGPATDPSSELCMSCHDEYRDYTSRKVTHSPAQKQCTECHNPHNSRFEHLLVEDTVPLCLRCHDTVKAVLAKAQVKHGATTEGKKCATCHDAHGSNIDALLKKLPFDLCVECHSKDGMVDAQQKPLTNFKKLLDQNPVWHAPVAAKDCSVCHDPHASANFRMLTNEYPSKFYESYSVKAYALCFECHNDQMAATATTTSLTGFRDGSRNLHFLHVNKTDRGRTCRACHEVHASKWAFHIREGVPFGNKGWILKLQFERTETGGTCNKSCHATTTYNRNKAVNTVKPAAK